MATGGSLCPEQNKMSEDNGKKNIVFVVGDSVTRAGADEDVKTIVSTFEKLYNATVYVELDREPDDYKPFFSELKTDETWLDRFAKCDFVAIFCLVHGTSNDSTIKRKTEMARSTGVSR
ncbi:hypothetical protein DOY81_001262 [Sarcophaga bullata]|nr:hypothetical protein DOY81_001262 [Sarcophaga bullata]